MSETKHTPGPWEARREFLCWEIHQGEELICRLPPHGSTNPQEDAEMLRNETGAEIQRRAYLLASAPALKAENERLREALQRAVDTLRVSDCQEMPQTLKSVRYMLQYLESALRSAGGE